MRSLFLSILVAVPSVLITWIVTKGITGDPAERCPAVAEVVAAARPAAISADPALALTVRPGDSSTDVTPALATRLAAPAANPDQRLEALLATPIAGYAVIGGVELYDAKGLFDYIDGAAPLYIDRQFRKLAAAEMKVDAGGELTADVYDMTDVEHAKAIYEVEATPTAGPLALGDQGRKSSMAVVFRKGPYYVKLTAFDANAEAALPGLARALVERML
jgi:hypothetical protein